MARGPRLNKETIILINEWHKTGLPNKQIKEYLEQGKKPVFDKNGNYVVADILDDKGEILCFKISEPTVSKFKVKYDLELISDKSKIFDKAEYEIKRNEKLIVAGGLQLIRQYIGKYIGNPNLPISNREIGTIANLVKLVRDNSNSVSTATTDVKKTAAELLDQFRTKKDE